MNTSMSAMGITAYKQKQVQRITCPIPECADYDVLVEIYAASINPIDFKIRDGKLRILLRYKMPLILGNDFAGKVVRIGNKVTRFKVGDAVYGRPRKMRIGMFAEFIAIHEDDIAIKPENLTFEEAASIPLVGLTSYQAFHEIIQLKRDDKILIQAGAGGVGTFAIQLAKAVGAYVATTASPAGEELVKKLGADEVINYREDRFEEKLSDYDAVYDTLGGENLINAFKILKPDGKIVSISGMPNARFARDYHLGFWKTSLFRLASVQLSRLEKHYHVQYHFLFMKPSGKQLSVLREMIEADQIKPVIDRIFPFEETQKALDYSESGRAKGKIVVKIKD